MCCQVAWWHGAVPFCSALPRSWQYVRGLEHGSLRSSCLAGLWVHLAVKLIGGWVYIDGWDSVRVSVSTSDPKGQW